MKREPEKALVRSWATCFAMVFLLGMGVVAWADPGSGSHRVSVECDRGETITSALARNAESLEIEFTGTCHESFEIQRDRVTLRGGNADATIVGEVRVVNSQHVQLENFTVRNSPRIGVDVVDNSRVKLDGITVRESGETGMRLTDSWVEVHDVSSLNNAASGITTLRCTSGTFSGRVRAHGNVVGIVVGTGAGFNAVDRREFTEFDIDTSGNGIGIIIQTGASLFVRDGVWRSNNNTAAGFVLAGNGSFAELETTLEARNNGFAGGFVRDSSVWQTGSGSGVKRTFANNGVYGLRVESESTLDFDGALLTVSGNGVAGVSVDNSAVLLQGATVQGHPQGDLALGFGSKASFVGQNQFGTIQCDSTVLLRGGPACSSLSATATTPVEGPDVRAARETFEAILRTALEAAGPSRR